MIDIAEIQISAGNGGNGIVSFRHEKYIAKGGPWGGDGGKGGNIIFEVSPHLNTLTPFRRNRHYKAQDGQNGMKNRKKGKDAEDLIVKVPAGTIIKDKSGEYTSDLTQTGQKIIVARGGQGGLGNWHFKSSVNRTPLKATDGKPGQELTLYLELKLIADVGLIGLPSSGKSTLLNSLTHTNVKTAKYHFTTLEPNLGVLNVGDFVSKSDQTLVLADIPGLIKGASEGKGLGHDFLRHIERTTVLVHLIDGLAAVIVNPTQLFENYKTIQAELKNWNPNLPIMPQIIAINKMDISEVAQKENEIKKEFKKYGYDVIFISAATSFNLDKLVAKIVKVMQYTKKDAKMDKKEKTSLKYSIDNLPNRRIVYNVSEHYSIPRA